MQLWEFSLHCLHMDTSAYALEVFLYFVARRCLRKGKKGLVQHSTCTWKTLTTGIFNTTNNVCGSS